MSDEQHTPEPEMPEPAAEASASSMSMGDFSTGQGMVALSGIILLAVWLIFEVITDDYGVATLTILLAAAAAILPRVNRASVEVYHSLSSLMKAIGYALAILGVVDIVGDLETSAFSDIGGLTLLAALLTYAAYVIAFLGARKIET